MNQNFSRYQILEKLGAGGMATVYKARDERLKRDVAIKVISTVQQNSQKFLLRFKQEARALANLNHPNIVQVLDYGEQEGAPFLVMDYLPGGTLKDRLGRPFEWKEAAALLAPVARALANAHQHKIIHRDVKPSNILFNAKGQPVLTDFGIAKVLERELTTELTGTGVIGTPQYMSPEQGLGKPVDPRSDVYSLGVVFYELLVGKRPFNETTPVGVLLQQTRQPLTPPRQHNPDLPEWVEDVVYVALAPDPGNRFQDMEAFAEVLERIARGEKVLLPRKLVRRSRPRALKKRWIWITSGVTLFALILVTAILLLTGALNKAQPTAAVELAANGWLSYTPTSLATTVLATSTSTEVPVNTPIPTETTSVIQVATVTLQPTVTQASLVIGPENASALKVIEQHDQMLGDINAITFSRDRKILAAVSKAGTTQVWGLETGQVLWDFQDQDNRPASFQRLAFSPDGALVAGLVDYQGVLVRKVSDGSLVGDFLPGKVQSLAFSADSQSLAIGYYEDMSVRVWKITRTLNVSPTPTPIISYEFAQRSTIDNVTYSPDGLTIWVNASLSLNTWRALDGAPLKTFTDPDMLGGSFTVIAPDQSLFYTNGHLWKVQDGTLAYTLSSNSDPFPCAVFSPDSRLFAACEGSRVLLWETKTGSQVSDLSSGLSADLLEVSFSADGTKLLIAAGDGSVRAFGR